MNIVIIDYALGNLFSLSNAFEYCGEKIKISGKKDEILNADALVLPGVGAFRDGMSKLTDSGLDKAIVEFAKTGKIVLGICLGMQLLMESSEEFGFHNGLGLIEGKVQSFYSFKQFDRNEKVPHIGWSEIEVRKDHPLFSDLERADMYFVHSFCVTTVNQNDTLATVGYGDSTFSAVIGKGNIYGCQFHPEKSSKNGLKIIENFIKMVLNIK